MLIATALIVAACQTATTPKPNVAQPEALSAPINPAVLDRAERSIEAGDYRDARAILERLMLNDPNNARVALLTAELQLVTGARREAIRIFTRLKENSSLLARAQQGIGIAHLNGGNLEAGYAALTDSVGADPSLWRAWNALGYYHDMKGEPKKSEDVYGMALAANPQSAIVYSNRGYSRLLAGDIDGAISDLGAGLEIDPGLEITRTNLRLALAMKGKYREALLGSPVEQMPESLNNVGFIALIKGDQRTAEAYFLEALKRDAGFNKPASRNLQYIRQIETINAIIK